MNRLLRVIPGARQLHTTTCLRAASNFAMPAMSPTMTEGGIVAWKVKEGEEFSAGDVILEIETDKAQIDVEAADDGIMAKIYKQDGAKDVQVGDTIAVLAEPGDDISSIELPTRVTTEAKKEAPEEAPKETQPEQKAQPEQKKETQPQSNTKPSSSTSYSAPANPTQTLLPSVASLLSANKISKEDAFAKISATGPHGRLLKGDVLAFIGRVPQGAPAALADEINKRSHLDLSNIKRAEPKAKPETEKTPEITPENAPKAPEKPKPEPLVFRSLLNLDHFEPANNLELKRIVNQAIKLAKADTVELAKPRRSAVIDPVFEAIIGPARGTKFYDVTVSYPKTTNRTLSNGADLYDILAGRKSTRTSGNVVASNVVQVEVSVNESVTGAEKRAQLFLNRLEYHLTVEDELN